MAEKNVNSTLATAAPTGTLNLGGTSNQPVAQPESQSQSQPQPAQKTTQTTETQTSTFDVNAFAAQLEAIKQEALKVQEQANKLAEQQQTTESSGITASSAPVVEEENQTINQVQNLINPVLRTPLTTTDGEFGGLVTASQEYRNLLDNQIAQLEARRKAEVESIERSFEEQKRLTTESQRKETGTFSSTLMRIGGFLGGSASHTGALINLANTHRQELDALEGKKAAAIQQANNAITDKQFELARLKVQEVKDLEKEIDNRRNKFFDQTMKVIEEERQQEEARRQADKQVFDRSLSIIDRVASTVISALGTFDNEEDQVNYLRGAAQTYGVDLDLLRGKVDDLRADRDEESRKQVISLAQKYPDAQISTADSFEIAAEKVRTQSKLYSLDIAKSETDIANSRSLIERRVRDSAVDFNDPVLGLYTQATGDVASSPSKARSILGYADYLLSGIEIVDDDYDQPLLENQVKQSDAIKLLQDSFRNLKTAADVPDSAIWQWLQTDEAKALSDQDKADYIQSQGKDPFEFGF